VQGFACTCKWRLDASTNVRPNLSLREILSSKHLPTELEKLGDRSSCDKNCNSRVSKGHQLAPFCGGKKLKILERIITMESNVQEKRDDHRCLLALVVWMCLISFSSQNTTLFGRVCCLDIRFRWIHHVKT
jgi:hypothetical protein